MATGSLLSVVRAQIIEARLIGSLCTLECDLRRVSLKPISPQWPSLQIPVYVKKEGGFSRPHNFNSSAMKDPFLPPFEDGIQVPWSFSTEFFNKTYAMLLNKFNVAQNHVLIVTKDFVPQSIPLSAEDLSIVFETVRAIDGLGFFNCGREAGPSQPHRHFQAVSKTDNILPFYSIYEEAVSNMATVQTIPELGFRHAIVHVPFNCTDFLQKYYDCLHKCGINIVGDEVGAHNVLWGTSWLMVVPRSHDEYKGIPGNGLNFIGSCFVRNSEQFNIIQEEGSLAIMSKFGFPNDDRAAL